ncbi:MAG: RcnB family protein [Hyphomonadaceae bacterium]|nr:RcnB family protein [Hyphomonadaceae bacterium]
MKRIALAAATALMLAGPLATTASAQDFDRGHRGDQNDNRGDRNDDNRGRNDDRNDRGRDDNRGDRANDHRGRGDNNWDRNDRGNGRWNDARNNGYSYNGRWYYGPPQAAHRGYQAGYRDWRRGDRLPSYYQGRYRQVDYRREHLRAPPRGYRYVEDDRGDYLLVGIATGVILSVILSQ